MPPKQSTSGAARGRPSTKGNASAAGKQKAAGNQKKKQNQQRRQQEESFTAREEEVDDFADEQVEEEEEEEDDEEDNQPKTIPPELLTRILHEFFEDGSTKITRGANEAVARYMDIFVREAIARAAAERDSGFLEVSLSVRLDCCRCCGSCRSLKVSED